jgi:hypothetical protein
LPARLPAYLSSFLSFPSFPVLSFPSSPRGFSFRKNEAAAAKEGFLPHRGPFRGAPTFQNKTFSQ